MAVSILAQGETLFPIKTKDYIFEGITMFLSNSDIWTKPSISTMEILL